MFGRKPDNEKMVLFHIAAIGWISPQTGYKIYKVAYLHKTANDIVKTKIGNLKPTVTSKMMHDASRHVLYLLDVSNNTTLNDE